MLLWWATVKINGEIVLRDSGQGWANWASKVGNTLGERQA